MATVYREGGFTFHIWPNDHAPPHVHAYRQDGHTALTIGEVPRVLTVRDMSDRDVMAAARIVARNAAALMTAWRRFHAD